MQLLSRQSAGDLYTLRSSALCDLHSATVRLTLYGSVAASTLK